MGKIIFPNLFPTSLPYSAAFPASEPGGLIYDVGGSLLRNSKLLNIMTFYWRVKSWQVTISGFAQKFYQINEGFSFTIFFNFSGTFAMPSFTGDYTEEDLICGTNNILNLGRGGSYTYSDTEGGSGGSPINCSLVRYPFFFQDKCTDVPSQLIAFFFNTDTLGGFETLVFNCGDDPFSPGGAVRVGTATIITVNGRFTIPIFSLYGQVDSGSFQLTLRATEYLTYGGTYDATTGIKV